MAQSTFTLNFIFEGATQNQADNRRDAQILDYAKAKRLAIYEADGVTVNPALVIPAVRAHVKQTLKAAVIHYRETQAIEAATSGIKSQVDAELP